MKKIIVMLIAVTLSFISCSPKLSPDYNWGNQRWVLTEMKTVPVQLSGTRRDAYIEFSPAEKQFTGNGGCNRISGSYTLEKKNHIQLGQVTSTKMSCSDISFETTFLSILSDVNRYEMNDNILLLKKNGDVLLKFAPRTRSN
jgi:heat shock protein HslJ